MPLKIHVDGQQTVLASVLYRWLGLRVQQGYEVAEARPSSTICCSMAMFRTGGDMLV